jgi:DNA polymerase I-like protein with 3'-5' exonuclease and polymerase domains
VYTQEITRSERYQLKKAKNDEQELIAEIKQLMEEAISLSVRLTVDCGTGKNWLEAH